MKQTSLLSALTLSAISAGLLLTSCEKKGDFTPSNPTGLVRAHITETSTTYDAVKLKIKSVEFNHVDVKGLSTWYPAGNFKAGIYDLTKFQNGLDTVLGTLALPPGQITQARLIIGDSNSVVVNGNTYPLNSFSGQQTGLKVNFAQPIETGKEYDIWFNFDAQRSITDGGGGVYELTPSIRVYNIANTGAIKGYVQPLVKPNWIWAIKGRDSVLAITDGSGYFYAGGLPGGTYKVFITPGDTAYNDSTITNVPVNNGNVTDLMQITLEQ
jgi:hypothetical protein